MECYEEERDVFMHVRVNVIIIIIVLSLFKKRIKNFHVKSGLLLHLAIAVRVVD